MSGFALILVLIGWIWSVRAGVTVGLLCAVLNFAFPPLSQMIFSFYEPQVRLPTVVLLLGIVLGILTSEPSHEPEVSPSASASIPT